MPSALKDGVNASITDYWDNLLINLGRMWEVSKVKGIDIELVNKIISIVDLMIIEWEVNNKQVSELHTNLLRSVLLLMDKYTADNIHIINQYDTSKIERIQNYIHAYIHLPDRLGVKHLSHEFGLSESGFRNYFSTNMGMSLTQYVNGLKIEMIKKRIKHSDHNLSAIALEFGFTDASHFTKYFMKHTALTPLQFKRDNKV